MKVIKQYNYRPSTVARSLATDRTHEICILAPRWQNEILASGFWSLIFLGISEQCLRRGYYASLSMISPDMDKDYNERILNGHTFDGYILMHREVTGFVMPALQARNLPAVLIGHDPTYPETSSIDVDNTSGSYQATRHLLKQGHQRIAIAVGKLERQESMDRLEGFRQALNEAGITCPDAYVIECEYSQAQGYAAMHQLLTLDERPTALFCASDVMAEGALLALYEAGLSVPDQMAIVGFDDLPGSQYAIPPLTTVRQPIYSKGEQAANIIIDRLEGVSSEVVHIKLKPELVVRSSCGSLSEE